MVFYTKDSPYSNHHKSPFTMEGKSFTTMETYIALQRWRIARQPDLEKEVWREEDPVKMKQVIRQCEGLHEDEWRAKVVALIQPALIEKIKQNEYIRKRLLSSGNKRISEASTNMLWGIGLYITHNNVFNKELWTGSNIMGTMLEQIREELRRG